MTTNIRDGVFETNSSSSHSVTVIPGEILDFAIDKATLRDGVIVLEPRGYGWEWRRYHSPVEKLSYLLAQINSNFLNSSKRDEDCAAAFRAHDKRAEMVISAVERVTGCRVEVRPKSKENYDIGVYIDGDSHGVAYEVLKDEESLLSFVFSKESFVQTGNNNSGPGETVITDDRGLVLYREGTYTTPPVTGGDPFSMAFSPEGGLVMSYGDGQAVEVPPEAFSLWEVEQHFNSFVVTGIDVSCGDRSMEMETYRATDAVRDFLGEIDNHGLAFGAVAELAITGRTGQMEPWDELGPLTTTLSCVARPGMIDTLVAAVEKLLPVAPGVTA